MHGGTNPGQKAGPDNPSWRHGLRSKEYQALKREIAKLTAEGEDAIAALIAA